MNLFWWCTNTLKPPPTRFPVHSDVFGILCSDQVSLYHSYLSKSWITSCDTHCSQVLCCPCQTFPLFFGDLQCQKVAQGHSYRLVGTGVACLCHIPFICFDRIQQQLPLQPTFMNRPQLFFDPQHRPSDNVSSCHFVCNTFSSGFKRC